jgi:hypothetical protein
MFSCLPGDHLQAPVLAAAIQRRGAGKPFLIVSTDDHDARLFVTELDRSLARRRMAPRYRFECQAVKPDGVKGAAAGRLRGEGVRDLGLGIGDSAFSIQQSALSTQHSAFSIQHSAFSIQRSALTAKILETKVDAVVLVAGPLRSAGLVKALRGRGFGGLVFGGPAMGRQTFLREAGTAAEGVVFPLLYQPGEQSGEFVHVFESRFGRLPDYAAAHTYDAVRLLVAAVRKAGLNRARIRDALRQLAPWEGATGTINWDALGANTRGAGLGTIRRGRVVSAADAAGCQGDGVTR